MPSNFKLLKASGSVIRPAGLTMALALLLSGCAGYSCTEGSALGSFYDEDGNFVGCGTPDWVIDFLFVTAPIWSVSSP